jgi:hypothetical protein
MPSVTSGPTDAASALNTTGSASSTVGTAVIPLETLVPKPTDAAAPQTTFVGATHGTAGTAAANGDAITTLPSADASKSNGDTAVDPYADIFAQATVAQEEKEVVDDEKVGSIAIPVSSWHLNNSFDPRSLCFVGWLLVPTCRCGDCGMGICSLRCT